jgi:hypothetical protein
MLIDCAKRIAESHGEYSVSYQMKGGFVDLSWKDVEIDGYELRVFATSLLPQQPAARLERLEAYYNAQVIDLWTFLKLTDGLDLQGELEMRLAPIMAIEERLQKMMETEEDADQNAAYLAPSPYMKLDWGATRAQQYLDKGDVDGMPENVKALLRRWILEIEQMQNPQGPANNATDPMLANGGAPGAAPPPMAAPPAPIPPPVPPAPPMPMPPIPAAA